MKLLHKKIIFSHIFTPVIAEILAFKLCPCCQKSWILRAIITITAGDITFLDMIFFNCIRINSPFSNFSFQLDLVAEIALTN